MKVSESQNWPESVGVVMVIDFAGLQAQFRPWRPDLGKVFTSSYAFDCETTLIDDDRPWIVPAYVLGAAYDGQRGLFITRGK